MERRLTTTQEQQLVQACLGVGEAAWKMVFRYCHEPLVRIIARLLGTGPRSAGEAEELAAELWYVLLREGKRRLRLFDAERGCLLHYLGLVARDLVGQHFRRQAGQANPVTALAQVAGTDEGSAEPSVRLWHEEFAATLTARERWFWRTCMTGTSACAADAVTPVSRRKLKERVLSKLRAYLAPE